jgi:hypothetical protein
LIIKIERTGGLAGLSENSELDSDDLPSTLETIAKKMMKSTKKLPLTSKSTPKGAADHYTYKISIKDGVNENIIECNQYDIQDDLKSLIKYVERNSNKK